VLDAPATKPNSRCPPTARQYPGVATVRGPRDLDVPARGRAVVGLARYVAGATTRGSRRRYGTALAIAAAGVALTAVACVLARRAEAERNQELFERRAAVLTTAVARRFQLTREVVLSLPALFEASSTVEHSEFASFVGPALRRHPSLAALEWAPLVRDEDRDAFEARIRRHFPRFEIREPDAGGEMVRSGRRPRYLPLVYMEPLEERVHGLEVLFHAGRNVEIEASIDSGTLTVSHRFQLVEDPKGVYSVAVYAPGYDRGKPRSNPAQRRTALLGLGIALFRLRPLIEGAVPRKMRDGIELALIDAAAPADVRVLYQTAPGTADGAGPDRMTHREMFDFGNRNYTVLTVARAHDTWGQWLVLSLGLGLTLVATASYLAYKTIGGLRRRLAQSVELGQYTLQEQIGEGGMGVVYRATHAMLRRPAAIKLLLKKTATEGDLARFEREVQLTSRLAHPNTISIFDYGRTAEGAFYYVMEFLDGVDLERLVRAHGPLEPSRAIHILAQVSGALAEAHLMGLIHRDIKPANIVLTERRDEPDVVKVVDFGLAKAIDTGERQLGITGVDAITGTPLYLAPEAITAPATVDGRADIYALGGVAYFLLTGAHVFEGGNVMQVLTQHLAETPVPPSLRLGRALAADLETLVLACLAKDRNARPATATELRAALLACRDAADYDVAAARRWWQENGASVRMSSRLGPRATGAASAMAIDLHDRPQRGAPTG
jgi:CHASE1-domain containing sensor protein